MKYTVTIRQPVPDNVRSKLERQLVERFGLNEQQAEKLAARRAGRLMKPTTQSRAELLLYVYESVGAQVSLEQVPEENDAPGQAFQTGGVWSPGGSDDVQLASPLRNNATLLDFIPPTSALQDSAANPFAPAPATAHGPLGAATTPDLIDPAELLPEWARKDSRPVTQRPSIPANSAEAQVVSDLSALARTPATGPGTSAPDDQWTDFTGSLTPAPTAAPAAGDDWGDFAGGLKLPETAPDADGTSRQNTEFLTAVTEDNPAQLRPRSNLVQQIRLGTLLPLGLSSLLTLGLLLLAVPGLQRQLVQDNARTLASTIATALPSSTQTSTETLKSVVNTSKIGFVKIEEPGNAPLLEAADGTATERLNQVLTPWLKTHPAGGVLSANGKSYVVSRMTPGQGSPVKGATTADAAARYVTVGLPTNLSNVILRNTLLLVALSTLIGLALASMLAGQAARRIVQPLSELVKVADAISLGDLTRPVKVDRNDEIGDLAQALERMRLSLEAAMDRLRRRKRS